MKTTPDHSESFEETPMTEQLEHTPCTPLEALQSVWGEGWHSLCLQVPGMKFRAFGFYDNPEELLAVAAMNPEANVWWGVHGLASVPQYGRGSREDVAGIVALSADFDWADDEAHSNTELPDELEVRRKVAEMWPQPTLVIDSGHGVQCYWTLTEELGRDEGAKLIDGFFRFIERTTGLHNDRIDIASILRVPGTYNQKTEPQRLVETSGYLHDEGYVPRWLVENCWDAAPVIEVKMTTPFKISGGTPPSPETARIGAEIERNPIYGVYRVSDYSRGPSPLHPDETPKDFMCRTYDGYAGMLRLGWQPSTRRGTEEQLTRPGKDPRMGTSATYHHDTNVCNIFTTSVDHTYAQVGLDSKNGIITLNPFDVYCIENRLDPRNAMSIIRKTLMPATPRPNEVRHQTGGEASEGKGEDSSTKLNLPDEFWEARPALQHIRDAAWSKITSPDAVFAGVVARYAALIPPTVTIPDSTLDIFFVSHGPSGSGKSSAGRCAAKLYPAQKPKYVMLDQNVGSGEGLAEAFFEWRDEDGNPCSGSKKGAEKVMTKWGLHFATDEGQALAASAGRMNSILIPTLCQAWMGEPIGQRLADPTKSRMIGSNKVRITAEIRIQTANGHKLFQEEYATTGLSQRMICVYAQDPRLADKNFRIPAWPGEMRLPMPDLIGNKREITYCPEIVQDLLDSRREAHNPLLAVNPLDTHSGLAELKLASILALWDARTEVSLEDRHLARLVLQTHRNNRDELQRTHTRRQEEARVTRDTLQAKAEMTVERVKDAEHFTQTYNLLKTKIKAGERPASSHLSKAQRPHRTQALEALKQEGIYNG
jgi:hypothetical protein